MDGLSLWYSYRLLRGQFFSAFTAPPIESIKLFFLRYTDFVWTLVKPLGSWAIFVVAGIDSAFFGFPLDPLVAGYVYRDHSRFLLYAVMAAAGSAAGCIVLYIIGYKGGEALLEKRLSAVKFNRIRAAFDRHEFWSLAFPAMMPPPFPFKIFVLAASVFEMNFWHFLVAIFTGRAVRFLLLSILVVKFGSQVVGLAGELVEAHWLLILLAAVSIGFLGAWIWFRSQRRAGRGCG